LIRLSRQLRIGIAGTGFGAAVHLPALQSMPGVTVAAIASARRDKAAEIARQFGISTACGGIEELLAQDLDAVTLALPPELAERATALALDRGLAVLAEKPLASSAGAAERLARLATTRTTMVDFEYAEVGCFRALHGLIGRGELGAIERINVDWMTHSYAHRHRIWSWKTDQARCGGVLTLLGTHVLFLIEWLCGRFVVTEATLDNAATQKIAPPGGVGAADSVALRGRTAGGAAVAIELCNTGRESSRHRWEVIGERGRAVLVNDTSDAVAGFRLSLASSGRPDRELLDEPAVPGDNRLRPFHAVAERFVAAARAGATCQPDFAVGARVQRLVDDIGALQRGQPATLRSAV